jgi:hypothetical protein
MTKYHRSTRPALAVITAAMLSSAAFAQAPPRNFDRLPVWSSRDGQLKSHGFRLGDMEGFETNHWPNSPSSELLPLDIIVCEPQMVASPNIGIRASQRKRSLSLASFSDVRKRWLHHAGQTSSRISAMLPSQQRDHGAN